MTTIPVEWKATSGALYLYRSGQCLGYIEYILGLGSWTATVLEGEPREAPSTFNRRGQAKAWLRKELGCEHQR